MTFDYPQSNAWVTNVCGGNAVTGRMHLHSDGVESETMNLWPGSAVPSSSLSVHGQERLPCTW